MPPTTVVLVHGAGSGPWVFDHWKAEDVRAVAVDLHADLDIARASTDHYANNVVIAIEDSSRPVAVCGWSMGGLVAAVAANRRPVDALVLLEPSPPAETQGADPTVELAYGTFDPQEVYGAFPPGVRARRESTLARTERKRGISVPRLPAHSLVVYGDEFPDERGLAIARRYGCEERYLAGLDHWDLVIDERVPKIVFDFVRAAAVSP